MKETSCPEPEAEMKAAVGPVPMNVLLVKLKLVLQPVTVFWSTTVMLGEQTSGVRFRTTVVLSPDPETLATDAEPPCAVTPRVEASLPSKRNEPPIVTGVGEPPGPIAGDGPNLIDGLWNRNEPELDAVSPSESSVTVIGVVSALHRSGGFARICVPVTETTVP